MTDTGRGSLPFDHCQGTRRHLGTRTAALARTLIVLVQAMGQLGHPRRAPISHVVFTAKAILDFTHEIDLLVLVYVAHELVVSHAVQLLHVQALGGVRENHCLLLAQAELLLLQKARWVVFGLLILVVVAPVWAFLHLLGCSHVHLEHTVALLTKVLGRLFVLGLQSPFILLLVIDYDRLGLCEFTAMVMVLMKLLAAD